MSELKRNKIMSKDAGGEYVLNLTLGDVFISFHHKNHNCIGFFVKQNELNDDHFKSIDNQVKSYFTNLAENEIEVKIIGSSFSIKRIELYFKRYQFQHLKKIEKDSNVDVVFQPEMNKVRVTKDDHTVAAPALVQSKGKFKVLVVDDSKAIRNILSRIFSTDDTLEVCAMTDKPSEVESLIIKYKPDVITLDIHMPEMDGIALLKQITPKYNIPTIMISSISFAEGPLVLEALENGAIDYIQKPEVHEIDRVTPMIIEKVKTAAKLNSLKKAGIKSKRVVVEKIKQTTNLESLIVLGSSTGGTEAIRNILTALPDQIPPMLIVQHIPPVFSAAFAKRMNELCQFEVKEAVDGDEVKANRVLVAPGGKQMKMLYKNSKAFVEINDDEPVNRFKPSVDYLFKSVAESLFTHTVAVILTGMGKDGAKGMLELRNLGVRTIAQDEETCVVFGMPKEAIAIGGAEYVEPLSKIAERIVALTKEKTSIKKIG
jgi:two-component system chemotaxis response regulator CheB